MQKLTKALLTTIACLGSFTSFFVAAKDSTLSCNIESQLQQIVAEKNETERLHRLFDLYWAWCMSENPDEASLLGYPGRHDMWPDLSQERIDRNHTFVTQFLNILNSISPIYLEGDDKVSYHIFKRILEEGEESYQFFDQYLLVNQMFGIHLHLPLVIDLMPKKTVEDYKNILSRLRGIPKLFTQVITLLDKGIELGVTPPRIALQGVPKQILNLMSDTPLETPFLKAFQLFPPSINEEMQTALLNEAKTIYQNDLYPCFSKFYSYITEHYLPNCRNTIAFGDQPKGQEWYAYKVRCSTTTTLTPFEIHAIGLKEVDRIRHEMDEVIKSSRFNGGFKEFLHFLTTDPQFFYSNRQELLNSYQNLTRYIESKLPLIFAKLPKLPFEVVPIPSYSEESQIAAYYCPGSVADNRPGYFFINTSYPEERPKWEMEPLALHEAVPGHHLQISLAQELQNLPEFRKNVHFTAYVEGWGLYAESLGSEIGLYQDPYSLFGRLSYEMLRAIRLVVDTGMHAMGWSREQAIDYFKQYVPMSHHEIVTEVDRYLVMPGQALAYKIGELKIHEMRRLAKEALGEQFDLKDFHHAWLQNGTVPLDIVEQHIHQWITESTPLVETAK
jgi:uncharacterized protein (DUF885 family)